MSQTTRTTRQRRIALALAGGGPLGAIYEIGALCALEETLDGIDFSDLQHYVGAPWRYTAEQARLTLWWYAMDPATNRFLWRDGVIQRLKGWGKDPLIATWSAFEFF